MEIVHDRIDDLMSSACMVNWAPAEVQDGPHEHVRDLLRYMDFVFTSASSPLFPLPPKMITALHFTSCTRVSNCLLGSLYDCASFNSLSAFNFCQDVAAVKAFFAERSKVGDLVECFREATQTAELLTSGNLEHILDANVRAEVYPQVATYRLPDLLRKFRPLGVTSPALKISSEGQAA